MTSHFTAQSPTDLLQVIFLFISANTFREVPASMAMHAAYCCVRFVCAGFSRPPTAASGASPTPPTEAPGQQHSRVGSWCGLWKLSYLSQLGETWTYKSGSGSVQSTGPPKSPGSVNSHRHSVCPVAWPRAQKHLLHALLAALGCGSTQQLPVACVCISRQQGAAQQQC